MDCKSKLDYLESYLTNWRLAQMDRLANDIVYGAKAIGEEINLGPRQVYRLAELGEIPTFKLGGTTSRRAVRSFTRA